MKRSIVNCFVQFLCLVIVFQVAYTLGKECGDPQCKSVIALGRAVMNFRGGGGQKVNLEQNESLEILAKNVGKDKDFFVRTSKGKEGLAAKQFIQESSIVIKKADRLWFKDDIPRVDLDPIKSTPSTVSGNGVEQEIVVDGAVLTNDVPNSLTPKVPIENAHANAEPIPSLEVVPNSQAPKGEETNEQYVADDENGKEENIESGEELNNEEEYDDEEAEDISDEDEDEIQEDQSEETKLMKKVDFITHHNDTAKDFTQKEQAGDSSRMTKSSVLVNDETAASAAIYPDIFETVTPVETTADNINPVTIEPALNTLETVASSDNQPTHPSRILAGGLGNILAHGHLHHHGHHHHHHGSHSHHDHANDNHHYATQDKQTTPEVDPVMSNAQSDDDKHLRHVVEQAKPDQDDKDSLNKDADLVELSTPLTPVEHEPTGFNDKVLMDNEYCENDVTDCSPIAAFVPPSIQHSNGDADYMNSLAKHPMEETVKRNGGGIEELQDDGNKQQDFLSFEQQPIGYYLEVFVQEALRLSDLILMLMITSFTLLMFSLGHYLINKNRQDKRLIYNLNLAERDLMTSYKEITLLKNELQDTKHKLVSIENNSFGSNDMVMALKAELETAEQVKLEMQDQISGLEKELENAAEAGLELNKMVAELLNQNGSNSIALSVEELQRQLNEQQQTILSMNVSLAEKSRENSQLQINLSNQASKFKDRLEDMERANTELIEHRSQLQQQIDQLKHEKLTSLNNLRQETSVEIERLTKEVKIFQGKADEGRKAFAVAQAKCEALEQCLKESKTVTGTSGMQIIDSIELKTQIALITKEKTDIQDKLQGEIIARQLVEDHMKMVNEEISTLKRDFSTIEKDKLEAETRLQVLSSYFKDKETQLQKELSVKEAMWMQQQGETTSTVEKIRHMQDEIQQLKSQNDKLRAEIEAQATAHKAQYTTLETRSHDAWLAARQAERRLEEARSESSALRRKLTALGEISTTSDGLPNASITQTDLGLTAPSPIRVESPNVSSLLGVLPPPRFMPPFMPGPPPPFMTPFMPPPHGPGEMRPPPLGRLMSPPPPPNNRYSPNSIIDTRGRYSPDRGRYSPDSRYDYSVMSTYETENDFSPPPSPPHHSRHANYDRDRDRDRNRVNDRERPHREGRSSGGYSRDFTPTGMRTSPPIQDPRNKKYAGDFSSGSQDSLGTRKSSGKYKTTGKSPS
ncbi:transport and Golgi organization protein 1 [Anopheles nili]|uniref:transport and Golgi organization protein 1 n=1 Tax=Anopheles nili TaxID=185578 RepID=UPI00237B1D41|nr:transport and Golgi organization protein 1 [Anopheles nili]